MQILCKFHFRMNPRQEQDCQPASHQNAMNGRKAKMQKMREFTRYMALGIEISQQIRFEGRWAIIEIALGQTRPITAADQTVLMNDQYGSTADDDGFDFMISFNLKFESGTQASGGFGSEFRDEFTNYQLVLDCI